MPAAGDKKLVPGQLTDSKPLLSLSPSGFKGRLSEKAPQQHI